MKLKRSNIRLLISCDSALLIFCLGIFVFFPAGNTHAELKKIFSPKIEVREIYDDNILLDYKDEKADWTTLISPGFVLYLKSEKTDFNLDYVFTKSFYKEYDIYDGKRHDLLLNWNQSLTQKIDFSLNDKFIKSEDPVLIKDNLVEDIIGERGEFDRNIFNAYLRYRFKGENSLKLNYSNQYYKDYSLINYDSKFNQYMLSVNFQLSRRQVLNAFTLYQETDLQGNSSYKQYEEGINYYFTYSPRTTYYSRYQFLYFDYATLPQQVAAVNNKGHHVYAGFDILLNQFTKLHSEIGYYMIDYDDGSSKNGGSFDIVLSREMKRFTFDFIGRGGFDQKPDIVRQNQGNKEYKEVAMKATYLLSKKMELLGLAQYKWEDNYGFNSEPNFQDKVLYCLLNFSYFFTPDLFMFIEGARIDRNSDFFFREFVDHRISLGVHYKYDFNIK
ncbi:hypothetical protein ACFLZQ_03285 [Thermodesulfobacteriota bacterium]